MKCNLYFICGVALHFLFLIKVVKLQPVENENDYDDDDDDTDKTNIFNGKPADDGQFKYQVSLIMEGVNHDGEQIEKQHFCNGAIINHYTVLTAAQCVDERWLNYQKITPGNIKIVAGSKNWADEKNYNRQVKNVIKMVAHSDFINNTEFYVSHGAPKYINKLNLEQEFPEETEVQGLGLVFVDPPFQISDTVSTVVVSRNFPQIGEQCYATGWTERRPEPPLYVMSITDRTYCNTEIISWITGLLLMGNNGSDDEDQENLKWASMTITEVHDQSIHTEGIGLPNGGRLCPGDAGAPLVCNQEITGIGSAPFKQAFQNIHYGKDENVSFISVPYYFNWIRENSQKEKYDEYYGEYLLAMAVQKYKNSMKHSNEENLKILKKELDSIYSKFNPNQYRIRESSENKYEVMLNSVTSLFIDYLKNKNYE